MQGYFNLAFETVKFLLNNYWWFGGGVFIIAVVVYGLWYTPADDFIENTVVTPVVMPLLLGFVGPFFLIIFVLVSPLLLLGIMTAVISWFLYRSVRRWRHK